MANFEISAPGRIILSGEHSAIHEKNVVATSLNLRTTLKFFELSDKSNVRIEFPNVNLELNIPLEEIRCVPTVIGRKVSNPVILLNYVKHLITVNDMWETDEQKFSLQIFFFLLYSIIYNERFKIRPFCLRVFSNIPIGSGLGSSTSFAICIASCFFHLKRLQQNNDRIELNTDELLSIKRYIIFCESVMQDYAFVSLDACACLFGQILLCTRINSAEKISMRRMEHIRKIKILLINSNIRQNYAEQVKQMKTVKRIFPEFNILNRFDEISNKIYSTIMDMNSPEYVISVEHQKRLYNELKSNILMNQQLLMDHHLSCPAFDVIYSIAKKLGFAGKFTGFRGGYVYILLPSGITDEEITNISSCFIYNNFHVISTTINCDGVRILI